MTENHARLRGQRFGQVTVAHRKRMDKRKQYGVGTGQDREKSNEIEAIPALLDLLDVKGAVIAIDAMGMQTQIAEKIIRKQIMS